MRTVYHHPRFRRLVAAVLMLGIALDATANPTGMTVQSGSATATTSGSQFTVTTTSQNTLLNWQSFNIAANETVKFREPSSTSIVWNQINNANPSQIYGSLQANGIVVLLNSSGFYFGPDSFVRAAGLVVSTANYAPPQNSGGGWEFNGPPPLASIVNYGQIKIGNGGSAFLIADQVENHGAISAPGGTIGLASGQTVLLSDRPDGRGLSLRVTLPGGSVDNEGRLIADGGTIALNARVVNQNGFIQADSVRNVNGTIELVASDQLTLGANSQIIASGKNSPGGSAGGDVTLKSGNDFSDSVGSQIITTGGAQGGNGGNVEISAPNVQSLNSSINARAQAGWTAGKLLLDPDYIILDTSGSGSAGTGTVLAGDNPGSTLDLNVNTAFANLAVSTIILQAAYDITLAGGTSWNLSGTIGANLGGVTGGQLTLEAGRNIIFGNGSKITDANNWSVALMAGYDFVNNAVQLGVGNIYLNGGSGQTGKGSIQLAQGSINLTAGNSIVVGSGCQLIDDGGTIGLNAQTVDQNGLIQADSVANQHGIIELVASDSLTLGANSQIIANGDNSLAGSVGGNVTLQSGNDFSDSVGSQITVTGGMHGGNGGSIEISAPNVLSLNSSMDASAQVGSTAGQLLLNSQDITLNASGANGMSGGTLELNVNSTFANFSQITLQASGDTTTGSGNISIAPNTVWNLTTSTGNRTSGQLTLESGGNIIFGDGSQITDANNWSVTLQAGYSWANNAVQAGVGNIYLNGGSGQTGSGSIQLAQGLNNNLPAINLTAGNSIIVGSGYVITTGGGGISAHALAGNIDTGSFAIGYYFETALSAGTPVNQAYDFSDGLGGISTEAGGNVRLTAGGNVTSVLPGANGYYYDGTHYGPVSADQNVDYATAGSGAYGNQPGQSGNVTIVAGGDVTGHYLVANGVGSIFAGVKMDANGNPIIDSSGKYVLGTSGSAGGTDTSNPNLALSLISGGWNVTAAQDILLQEVRNPNGVFDYAGGAAYDHYFDYSSGDYVNLTAGNLVQLGASPSVLPRLTSLDSINVPFIYPSILNISAGAGGVQLAGGNAPFNQLILFPSPQGSLTINTTDGGSLVGDLPTASDGTSQIFNLIVSDSSHQQYRSGFFGLNDHAATPVHLDNPTPIVLNISGDMSLVFLGVPEAAQITVGGNMDNCGFQGMNLSANDVTSINVTGDINNRSAFTSVDLSQVSGEQAPLLSYLAQALTGPGDPLATTLATSFYYNPTTQILTYQNIPGQSLASVLQLLQNLTVQVYKNGVPQWTDPNDTIPLTTTVSVLNAADAQALLAQYNTLGGIPSGTSGYILGGGGAFDISARNMDLGTSVGILSKGVGLYKVGSSYPLANSPPQGAGITQGADINVDVTGNLDMYSSSIASLNGGNIYINAGGDINAGSADFTITALGARGIYTTDLGNVYVYANGDINVNGSRIAVYDTRQDNSSGTAGGSVTVVSRNGNIDAGNGGSGFVVLNSYQVGPDHTVTAFSSTIPGSGIMQVSYTQPGNMLVEAPNGTVNAGAGGIPQLLLTGSPLPESTTLFDLPLNLKALAGIFDLELTGNMKAALDLQKTLNGVPGNSQVNVYAGYELQELAASLTTAEVLAGDTLQKLPDGLQEVVDKNGNLIELAFSLTPAEVKAGDTLQTLPGDLQAVVDKYGNPIINALNLSDGTLVEISDNQDITAAGSGVLGAGSVTMEASGNITGTIFAFNNVNVNAANNIDVNVLGLGDVNVASASGTVSGTIIGVSGVSASGGSIDANLESNGSVSGNTSGQSGLAPGTAANAASQGMASENSASPAKNDDTTATDDDVKKKGKMVATVRKAGRVTVILPPRQQSKAQTPEPRT